MTKCTITSRYIQPLLRPLESAGGVFVRSEKLPEAIHELEKQMIEEAMARSGGNQRRASEILGITERMLGYRLKHYGIKFF